MHKVVLAPGQTDLNLRLPTHVAIKSVIDRSLRLVHPCNCLEPWSTIELEESWQDGNLRFSNIEACCLVRVLRIQEALPGYRRTFTRTTRHEAAS